MKKTLFTTFFFISIFNIISFSSKTSAQALPEIKHDYVWLFGYASSSNPNNGFGGSRIDFNTFPPVIEYEYRDMDMDIANTSMCNNEGVLQYYSNGQAIASYDNLIMDNGNNINPDIFTQSMDYGLILFQGLMSIPPLVDDHEYYMIHEELSYVGTPDHPAKAYNLYYSQIDMDANNSLGRVVEKNISIVHDTLDIGKITACKHANGRDWWILVFELDTNKYYRVLLSPEGFVTLESQEIGTATISGVGQAVFSPDGHKFVRLNSISSTVGAFIDIYDFDRCTGLLSNHTQIFHPEGGGRGIGISPNSRYLYFNRSSVILQYDLESIDIMGSADTVAVYDGFVSPTLPTRFYMEQLAPDGKIYLSATNTVDVLHVIHNPDQQGAACNMEQHGIQLPTRNLFSIPNFPNYRLGPLDGSPCDTLGLNNTPVAFWRNDTDTADVLHQHFVDLSYYEPATWFWDFGDGSTSTERNPEHYFPEPGSYEVCLTVSNAYATDTECQILNLGVTATEELGVFVNELLKVYPNPANDYILLEYFPLRTDELHSSTSHSFTPHSSNTHLYNNTKTKWFLYDATGRLVMEKQLVPAERHRFVLPDRIGSGLYFWMVKDGARIVENGKILVRRM